MRMPSMRRDGRLRLTAKTAYGLLSTIKAIIKSDARTMQMGMWGGTPGNARGHSNAPACGTVGCIGGWTQHLAILSSDDDIRDIPAAARILGFNDSNFTDSKAINGLFFGELMNDSKQGTPLHARRVIALITRFQRTHRARLLAKKVVARAR